ncbi:MAG TPA: hypothetical protein VG297_15865 [Bryobacteraceae bacterium]|jgi:hypothetical protein|nr:hypothetical protein [Bryobacteraceae bacterium]
MPALAQVAAQPEPAQTPVATQPIAPPPAAPAAKTGPDYPDPRTFTVGVFYWVTGAASNPGLITGRTAFDFETLSDLGKVRQSTPVLELSIPITRTGELKFEGSITKGDGNQVASADTDLFATQFYKGDQLSTQYQITRAKLYLDDLLYPHKFPVAKFRVKSLWEVQFVKFKSTIDAPLVTAGETGQGTKQIVLPTFGLAAEYAIVPHVLLRVAGSGFGLYHRADIWDGEATISVRRGQWELVGGGKAFHFKSAPNSDEYVTGTIVGGFAGLRWHWSL